MPDARAMDPARSTPSAPAPQQSESPALQFAALAIGALAVVGATAVGWRWAGRPARIGPITMGPGGWVSVKGARPPADPGDRPLWAKLLRAYRL